MKNFVFVALFGICNLSLSNSERFRGDLRISDSNTHTYSGLTVGGNMMYMGSGRVLVKGDAMVKRDLIFNGNGEMYVKGRLTVKGKIKRNGSGNLHADGGIVNNPK